MATWWELSEDSLQAAETLLQDDHLTVLLVPSIPESEASAD